MRRTAAFLTAMMLLFLLSACSAGAPAESSESPAEAAELTEKGTAPEETGETAAQVILRWNLQRGIVVIPGSSNPDNIRENLELFDFELTDEEMEKIRTLDRNEKHDWY